MAFGKVIYILVAVLLQAVVGVVHPDGVSSVSRYQDDLGNYKFGYTVSSVDGEHFHKADKDETGRVIGSYGLTEADGRQRVVDYVADQGGFRAHVRSNEPGLASSRSAAVTVIKTNSADVTGGGANLDFAASDSSRSATPGSAIRYGERVKETASRVEYLRPFEEEQYRRRRPTPKARTESDVEEADTTVVERQGQSARKDLSPRRRLSAERKDPEVAYQRAPLIDPSAAETPRISVPLPVRYQPPLDPNRAVPLTAGGPVQSRSRSNLASPAPSTPPYGGFETREPFISSIGNTLLRRPEFGRFPPTEEVTNYPAVSMSSVHGGYGNIPYSSVLQNGNSRGLNGPDVLPYPIEQNNNQFSPQRLPVGTTLDGQRVPGRPNLILRAVAIPNGIQALPVDPSTGQVQNVPDFPVYDPVEYSRDSRGNVDDDDDRRSSLSPDSRRNSDSFFRDYNGRQLSREFGPPLRDTLSSPRFGRNSSFRGDSNGLNYIPGERSLSRPSQRELEFVSRVVQHVNRHRNVNHPRDPYSLGNQPPAPPDYFRGPQAEYPPFPGHPEQRDFFDEDFPELRPGEGGFGRSTGFSRFPESRPGVGVRFGDRLPALEDSYFDEPRYGNSRGYRSAPPSNSRASSDDLSSSAAENKRDSAESSTTRSA